MKFESSLRVVVAAVLLCTVTSLPGKTFTVTKTNDTGVGSLRQAILNANTNSDLDTITFNLSGTGVKTILPASPLPIITSPVIIDGTTQPGYTNVTPLIEINGTNAGSTAGLDLRAGNSLIRGLTINRFQLAGIVIMTNGNNVIER